MCRSSVVLSVSSVCLRYPVHFALKPVIFYAMTPRIFPISKCLGSSWRIDSCATQWVFSNYFHSRCRAVRWTLRAVRSLDCSPTQPLAAMTLILYLVNLSFNYSRITFYTTLILSSTDPWSVAPHSQASNSASIMVPDER